MTTFAQMDDKLEAKVEALRSAAGPDATRDEVLSALIAKYKLNPASAYAPAAAVNCEHPWAT